MTAVLLVVFMLCVLYLALHIHQLENAVTKLARIVNKPRRRDRALRKEIAQLEEELEEIYEDNLDPDEEDVREARPFARSSTGDSVRSPEPLASRHHQYQSRRPIHLASVRDREYDSPYRVLRVARHPPEGDEPPS